MPLKVAMAQINPTVGDLEGNSRKIEEFVTKAKEGGAELVIFPELAITGYPPQDLLYEQGFLERNREALDRIARSTEGIAAVVGFVDFDPKREGKDGTVMKFNAAALIEDGSILGIQYKTLLPTYDVFDEDRYFTPAREHHAFKLGDTVLGIEICEDLWDETYDMKVTRLLAKKGCRLIVNLSASPFYLGKLELRRRLLREKALSEGVSMVYVNQVGGQDELVFDGGSMAIDSKGRLVAMAELFEEDLVIFELREGEGREVPFPQWREEELLFKALVLGIRDYFAKTGFDKAVIGLSGGIDSSLTAALAVEALGRERVLGVAMPSRYSSRESLEDAQLLARNLGIDFRVIGIEPIFGAFEEALREHFEGLPRDVTEENLQARIRGTLLMALANKLRAIVISTGNKTELALGYCTLYGDMVGGLAAIGDVSKLQVYQLARYVNERAGKEVIPRRCFTKPPSAELREDQVDPFDYSKVSPLVDEIIEDRAQPDELLSRGYPRALVEDTLRRLYAAEYKRRQAPPTIKVTKKAFGIGRKYPIVNRYTPL